MTISENSETLEKRTHCYVMRPAYYEISGCKCGNNDPDWSEYRKHLWCSICEIDFIPECDGMFSGPILVNTMDLLGIDLRRVNLETGEIEGMTP